MLVCDPLWRASEHLYIRLRKCWIHLQDCLHLSFLAFCVLVCARWWVVEQLVPPRSPCYEAGTVEFPSFTLAAEWAAHHCHSLLVKGINRKSLKLYLLDRAKCTVWVSLMMLWMRNDKVCGGTNAGAETVL